ncbi:MAG TPA: methyltransferase [Candidatus Binatia bacterium]
METSPAERLFQMITGFALSQSLSVAARLGIADLLKDGPKGSDELAKSAGVDESALARLLRFLAGHGVFAEFEDKRFKLTPLAECLQTGAPGSMRTRAIFWGEEWVWRPWGDLVYSVQSGRPAFDRIYGTNAFDFFARNPEAAEIFQQTMLAQAAWEAAAVVAAYDFSPLRTIVEVGCGDGSLLAAMLQANPRARGVFFDRPYAVEKARALVGARFPDRSEFAAGDFFESVPAGGDAYILKHVIHDWDDAGATAILKNCRRRLSLDGRLLVIESILRPASEPDPGRFIDLHMLVRQTGRERSESEYRDLFAAAGFGLSRVVPTRSQVSVIEGKPE